MATDNVPITAGAGTSVRTFADASGNEWPSGVLCYATTVSPGANVLQPVMPAYPLPVTIAAAQVSALTPPAAITGFALESGHLASLDGKDFATQTTLAALNAKVTACNTGAVVLAAGSAAIGSITNTSFASTQSGTWNVGINAGTNVIGHVVVDSAPTTAVTGTFYQATQPVSGTVSLTGAIPAGTNVIGHAIVDSGAVTATPVRGALTNRSGTITTGGTSQVLAASNSTRSYLFILNPTSATESLWIDFTASAVAASPSIELQPGQSFTMEQRFASTEAVNVIAATTAHAFTAKEG